MPERSRLAREPNRREPESSAHVKDPAAVALGRKGGKIGGKRRAAAMTPEQRSDSARKAALARWSKDSA